MSLDERDEKMRADWKREQADGARMLLGLPPLPVLGEFFRAVDIHGLEHSTFEPQRYIVDPLIPHGLVTVLSGHGGSGKTQLALILAAHVAAGRSWAGFWTEPGRVLIASLEDTGERIRAVLRRIVDVYGLPWRDVEDNITVLDGTAADASLAIEIRDPVHGPMLVESNAFAELAMAAGGFDLVIVDNASDAYDGNENERRAVRKFMRGMLGKIAREKDCAVLLLAHVDKLAARGGAKNNTYSGSTAWHNSARSRIAVVESEIGSPMLVQEKLNVGKRADPVTLQWNDRGVLMPAERNPAFLNGAEPEPDTLSSDAAHVLRAIEAVHASGDTVPNTRGGNQTTLHYLRNYPELPADLRAEGRGTKGDKARFWNALTYLERAGLIVSEEYQNEYRHERKRWVPASVRQSASIATDATTDATTQRRVSAAASVRGGTRGTDATDALTQTPIADAADDYRRARDGE